MSKDYRIWCTVSGGVTGTRSAWLKKTGDEVAQFRSREEAEEEATRLEREMNGPNAKASFYYRAVELPEEE